MTDAAHIFGASFLRKFCKFKLLCKEANNSKYVSHVKKLLYRRILFGTSDGRFFLSTFYYNDKQGNIILQDAIEYRSTKRSAPSPMEQRVLCLILIPYSCRKTCHVDCSINEQLSLRSLREQKS
uniref:LSM domain-containing protein n=1 Tax=Solanum lycopersicum TaxID=4081 RepID=K4CKK2_SOLLC